MFDGLAPRRASSPTTTPTSAGEAGAEIYDLRAIGQLRVQPRFYGQGDACSSWVTIQAADPTKAGMVASKYLEDLIEYGEVKLSSDPAVGGTRPALAGHGQWLLGLEGSRWQSTQAAAYRTP